jgi:hypothetical protein
VVRNGDSRPVAKIVPFDGTGGNVRDSTEDAEVTDLLRERDRIDARLAELGVRMPRRPGGTTLAEWDAEAAG